MQSGNAPGAELEATNADFIIGGDFRDGNGRAFKGRILELDLYRGILSAEKIQSLYENGAEAVTQGKIEYETKPIRRGITASPDLISKQMKERIYETLRKSSANQRK